MTGLRAALVTGATGFIGAALVRRLLSDGVRVYCLVRKRLRASSVVDSLRGAEVIEAPSLGAPALERCLKSASADVLFNLASYGVSQEDRDPEILLEGNVCLVAKLVVAAASTPLRLFVHAGSSSEYGAPLSERPLSEEHPLRPISVYGAAKAASELYGNALAARLSVPFVTLRLFGVFGNGEGPHRLIPYLIHRLRRDEPADLTGGEQTRDFLYVDDVTEAFVVTARHGGLTPYEAYNICSAQPVRVKDVAELVAREMNKPLGMLQWDKRPYRKDEAMWIVGDNRRFRGMTTWRPNVSLRDGIRRMVAASVGVISGAEHPDVV